MIITAEQYKAQQADPSLRTAPSFAGLGTMLGEGVKTDEMLAAAGLAGWNVRLEPAAQVGRGGPDHNEVVRTNPHDGGIDTLGWVGGDYVAVQNEDVFAFGDNLLDGGSWFNAGDFKNGAVVFGALQLDSNIVLDPRGSADPINSYLLVSTSHNGSLGVFAGVTTVRVWCWNTFQMAIKNATRSWKMRHTQTIDGRIALAREALGISFDYVDRWQVEAEAMIETELTRAAVDEIFLSIFPKPEKDSKAGMTRWENKINTLNEIHDGPTTKNLGESEWKVWNTITEFNEWFKSPRNDEAEGVLSSAFNANSLKIVDSWQGQLHALAQDKRLITV